MFTMGTENARERGIALMLVLCAVLLLSVLGLSMTLNTMVEFTMANQFETHAKAFDIADAGFQITKASLENKDFTTLLSTSESVPQYITYTLPASGSGAYRNPIFVFEARNVNFSSLPSAIASRNVNGLLTPLTGTGLNGGRYFAKITDNDDEAPLGLSDDPNVDVDDTVYLRVVGVMPNAPAEAASYGGTIKNSIAVIEGLVRHDRSLLFKSPFTIYGVAALPAQNNPSNFFNGSAFNLDGYDHSGMSNQTILGNHSHSGLTAEPALSVVFDSELTGDALVSATEINTTLSESQKDRIVGEAGNFGTTPSLKDVTVEIRSNTDPDAQNIFDVNFVANFARKVGSVADARYDGNTSLSGQNIQLGTDSNPKVTVVYGDLYIGGSGSGYGLLVVTGELNCQGDFTYEGLVLALGEGLIQYGSGTLFGAAFAVNYVEVLPGQYVFGIPKFTVAGSTDIYYKSASVRMALSLLPLKLLSWREITPEIEP
ncbi:MAG: hypothetical protein HY645_13985 [Acidobacteria bacterium]|nr:hypothetical protein [Acidobacteriota bacterium]